MGGYVTPAVELEGTELPPPPANLPVRGEQEVTEPLQHHRNKYTQLANTGFQNVTMTCSKETNQGNIKKKKNPERETFPMNCIRHTEPESERLLGQHIQVWNGYMAVQHFTCEASPVPTAT